MKVLCINDFGWSLRVKSFFGFGDSWRNGPGPEYGDIDDVVQEEESDKGKLFYWLRKWPGAKYEADWFIPLSEMDERQFEREPIRIFNSWPEDKGLGFFYSLNKQPFIDLSLRSIWRLDKSHSSNWLPNLILIQKSIDKNQEIIDGVSSQDVITFSG